MNLGDKKMSKIMYGVKITSFDYYKDNERSFHSNVPTKYNIKSFKNTFSFNWNLMLGAVYGCLQSHKTPMWMKDNEEQRTIIESKDSKEFSLVKYKLIYDEEDSEPKEERIVIMKIEIISIKSNFLEEEL